MAQTGPELLILFLIIAGFMLFNHLAQKAAKRLREQQQAAERDAAARAAGAPEEEEPLEDIWGRPVSPPPPPPAPIETVPAPLVVHAAPAPPRRAAHPLFRTPQDLRRAVIVMTVLGPCRALEPLGSSTRRDGAA